MIRERYVLLGLAGVRTAWFQQVSQWAATASLPAEFIRCVSIEEVRVRLASGRAFSALLVDGGVLDLDRDLMARAHRQGCAVLVVGPQRDEGDLRDLGVSGVLRPDLSRDELVGLLRSTARMVGSGDGPVDDPEAPQTGRSPGRMFAVTGPGGTGASVAAIALGQGLALRSRAESGSADGPGQACTVVLADLCREADQAMLHDSRSVVPGLQELVESHRWSMPAPEQVIDQTFDVPERGYRLLLGLRRPRHWVSIRPEAFGATLRSLRGVADVVVADIDPDVEGEDDVGSPEVEERNAMSRGVAAQADVVVVVGEPSMKGVYSLVRTCAALLSFGVAPERLLPVVNRSPRSPRRRSEVTSTFAQLLRATTGAAAATVVSPTYLPASDVERALRDGTSLPGSAPARLTRSVLAVMARSGPRSDEDLPSGVPVAPGSFSGFTSPEPHS